MDQPRHRRQLWIDADPSGLVWTGLDCDDDLAILAAQGLEAAGEATVAGLSICAGNAPLLHTWENAKTLQSVAKFQWNLSKGAGWNTMQPAWTSLRMLARCIDEEESSDAAEAIIRAAAALPARSLTVLCLGPPSNLARALRRAPWLAERLEMAVLMGGELTHSRLDLNFMTDRAAAREILASSLRTMLVPIQTCAQVAVTPAWLQRLEQCPPRAVARRILPKMRLQTWFMPKLVNRRVKAQTLPERPTSPGLQSGFIPWDLVALLATSRPHLFSWESWAVELPSCELGEPCDGTMRSALLQSNVSGHDPFAAFALRTSPANAALIPWIRVEEGAVLEQMLELLCSVHGSGPETRLQLGFVPQLSLAALLILAAIALAARVCTALCTKLLSRMSPPNIHASSKQEKTD
eukprot:s3398_g8.t1